MNLEIEPVLIPKSKDSHSENNQFSDTALEAAHNLLEAAFHPNKSLKELQLVTEGTLYGITKEIERDPQKALEQAATSVAAGAAFGVGIGVIAAEAPLVGAACVGGATVAGAHWLWTKVDPNNPENFNRNDSMKEAMDRLWQNDSPYSYQKSLHKFETAIGKDGLEVATGFLSGAGAASAAKCTPAALAYIRRSPLKARIEFNILDKNWVKQPDGTKVFKNPNYDPVEITAFKDGRRINHELDTGVKTTRFNDGKQVTEYPNGNRLTKAQDFAELEFPSGEKWIQRDGAKEIHKTDGTIKMETLAQEQTTHPDKMIFQKNHARGDMTSIDPFGNVVNYRPDASILKFNLSDKSKRSIEYLDGSRTTWDNNSATFKTKEGNTYIFGDQNGARWWGIKGIE